MIGQKLVLVFKEDKAYLASDRPLSFGQLGLSDIASTFKAPAFWTIKVLNYQEDQKKLFCEITAYENGSREFAQQQHDLAEQLQHIERVTFHSIDTTGLLKTMEGKAMERIRPVRFVPVERPEIPSKPAAIAPQRYVYRETFSVPLKEVRFKLGGVVIHRKFKKYPQTIELTIANYDLREEFDAIKNYFANVLQSKKIQVTATIHILDGIVVEKEASSPEIDRIDQQLIDNVKFDFVKATVKKQLKVEVDKSLFTMDEYFDTFADEKFQSNTFYKNDRELFEDLLTISKTKHYKHLRFLSSKHAYEIMKLRFVHKPFSFIFLIEGDRNYHVIWETLDTEEATYIWHLPKNLQVLKMTIRKVEDIINIIKVQGKTAYIAATEDAFRRIYHDYSELADGFVKWKGELEHFLT